MKVLVTHINPHLDDIFGIWLFRKFHPNFKDAEAKFISAEQGNQGLEETEDKVYIGVGRGRFDEHKEGLNTCAGSLVYEYLNEQDFIPKDELTKKALEKLAEWNLLVDTGRAPAFEFDEFSVQSFIRTKDSLEESSKRSLQLGEEILDRILEVLKRKEQSILDWEKRIEFESRFGKSAAVISETLDREFCREKGGGLFLMYDPKYKSVQFFTPSFEIDLEPIYHKVKSLDPEASWFLHQSHHMVICGSSSAPDSKPTKLSFEQLIEIAKSV